MASTHDDIVQAIGQHLSGASTICSRAVGDDGVLTLRATSVGPVYRVEFERNGDARLVHGTPYADEAAGVYEAFDGQDRGLHVAYQPRGAPWPESHSLSTPVYAVGGTIEGCVGGFLDLAGDVLREGSLEIQAGDPGRTLDFQWEARFASDGTGTWFHAAGRKVPGGYVMTWWK